MRISGRSQGPQSQREGEDMVLPGSLLGVRGELSPGQLDCWLP